MAGATAGWLAETDAAGGVATAGRFAELEAAGDGTATFACTGGNGCTGDGTVAFADTDGCAGGGVLSDLVEAGAAASADSREFWLFLLVTSAKPSMPDSSDRS